LIILILSKFPETVNILFREFVTIHFVGILNVPITEVAKAIGKDAQYVRVGLQMGILKFGHAMKMENSSEYNYYCPDRKVWEETGYFKYVL